MKPTLHARGINRLRTLCGRSYRKLSTTGPAILDWPVRDRKVCQVCVASAKALCRRAKQPATVSGFADALFAARSRRRK